MTLIIAVVAFLFAWAAYTVTLVRYSTPAGAETSRHRPTEISPGRHRHGSGEVVPVATPAAPTDFWIVVRCVTEARVAASAVRAALALRGPAGSRGRVLAVDDGTDGATSDMLARIDHSRLHVLRREPTDARHSAGAAADAVYRTIREVTHADGVSPDRVGIAMINDNGRYVRLSALTELGAYPWSAAVVEGSPVEGPARTQVWVFPWGSVLMPHLASNGGRLSRPAHRGAMTTTATPRPWVAAPTRRSEAAHARRNKRQNAALLTTASLLGLWLGLAAPQVSPVSPPVANPIPAAEAPAQAPAATQAPTNRGRQR